VIIFPYQATTIDIPCGIDVARARLVELIRPSPSLGESLRLTAGVTEAGPPFQGSFDGERFKIHRVIGYGNSFLPILRGSLRHTAGGPKLEVRFGLHILVVLFFVAWYALLLPSAWRGLTASPAPRALTSTDIIFLVFPVFMLVLGFIPEANIALRRLRAGIESA